MGQNLLQELRLLCDQGTPVHTYEEEPLTPPVCMQQLDGKRPPLVEEYRSLKYRGMDSQEAVERVLEGTDVLEDTPSVILQALLAWMPGKIRRAQCCAK